MWLCDILVIGVHICSKIKLWINNKWKTDWIGSCKRHGPINHRWSVCFHRNTWEWYFCRLYLLLNQYIAQISSESSGENADKVLWLSPPNPILDKSMSVTLLSIKYFKFNFLICYFSFTERISENFGAPNPKITNVAPSINISTTYTHTHSTNNYLYRVGSSCRDITGRAADF